MSEQLGTKLMGSTTIKNLFKNTMGPDDIVPAVVVGNSAATYPMGAAMIDSATSGLKARYTNALNINNEAVGTGDGTTATFSLAHANVILSTLKPFLVASGALLKFTLSVGTGAAGVDQIVFDIPPANAAVFQADYSYHNAVAGIAGACVLMRAVTTTVGGGNVTADACMDGAVDTSMIVDSAGVAVDAYFKAALPDMLFI